MTKAKLFQNGQSQAVRLPKEFRFENQKEVLIKKVAEGIVLIKSPKDFWKKWYESLGSVSDDFMNERSQGSQQREEIFQ